MLHCRNFHKVMGNSGATLCFPHQRNYGLNLVPMRFFSPEKGLCSGRKYFSFDIIFPELQSTIETQTTNDYSNLFFIDGREVAATEGAQYLVEK